MEEYRLRALEDKVHDIKRELDSLGYDVRRLQENYVSTSHDIEKLKDRVRELEQKDVTNRTNP